MPATPRFTDFMLTRVEEQLPEHGDASNRDIVARVGYGAPGTVRNVLRALEKMGRVHSRLDIEPVRGWPVRRYWRATS